MSEFALLSYQVPSPPEKSREWSDVLRWMICVMDPADTRLSFIAGCLSHALKNGGLTKAQADACNKIYARVIGDFGRGILVCQNKDPAAQSAENPSKRIN
jgi:hypothetical protein